MNKYASLKGTKVRAAQPLRSLTADFPGWGKQTEAHFTTVPAGTRGTVDAVNSHGSAPYTRYCVTWANGARTIDADPASLTWPTTGRAA